MAVSRSAFAHAPIHAPAGAHQPFQLIAIRCARAALRRMPKWMSERGRVLNALAQRLELAELWRTDLLEWRVVHGRAKGVTIGERCRLYSLQVASEAELLEIGDEVIVSGDVMFVTHDGAVFTDREHLPDVNGHYGRIRIGDRCFIGMRAIIMPGVELGARCIVAAGAVVFDSFPPDSVVAGNPAEYVCSASVYLKLKRHSDGTVYDPAYPFPLKYPPERLAELMAQVAFRPVNRRHATSKPGERSPGASLRLRS